MLFLLLHMLVFVLGFLLVAATLISAIRTFVLPRSAPVKLTSGVNPFDQTSVQVKLCCSESGPPQILQEAHSRGWNVTASYCTHPR